MTYRIRYKTIDSSAGHGEDEALVEAGSPTEALVKFRCTRQFEMAGPLGCDEVTSVSAADWAEPTFR